MIINHELSHICTNITTA